MEQFEEKITDKLNSLADSVSFKPSIESVLNRTKTRRNLIYLPKLILIVTILITLALGSTGGFLFGHNLNLASANSAVKTISHYNSQLKNPSFKGSANSSPNAIGAPYGTNGLSCPNGQTSGCPKTLMRINCPMYNTNSSGSGSTSSGNSGSSSSQTNISGSGEPQVSTQTTTAVTRVIIPYCGSNPQYQTVFKRTTDSGIMLRMYKINYSYSNTGNTENTGNTGNSGNTENTGNSGGGSSSSSSGSTSSLPSCNVCQSNSGQSNSGQSNSGQTSSPLTTTSLPISPPSYYYSENYALEMSNSDAVDSTILNLSCSTSTTTSQLSTLCYSYGGTFGYLEGAPSAFVVLKLNPENTLNITRVSGSLSQVQNTLDQMTFVNNIAVLSVPLPIVNSSSNLSGTAFSWNLNFYNSSNAVVYSTLIQITSSTCPYYSGKIMTSCPIQAAP